MIHRKAIQTGSRILTKNAIKGLLFMASSIGLYIGNPFEAAKRMVQDDFIDYIGRNINIKITGINETVSGRLLKVKKGFVVVKDPMTSTIYCVNHDKIDYIVIEKR